MAARPHRPHGKPRVLVFRHEPSVGLGLIGPVLEAHGFVPDYAGLCRDGAALPSIDEPAGLIVLGGHMSVNDPLPYLRAEMDLISLAVERGRPVLGICLGAQLTAKALGARVYPAAAKEIGWYEVRATGGGQSDALFAGLGPAATVFQWHGETFDLPPGAVRLASSQACPNQAFRVGDRAYGVQFHLEVTPGMIEDWCAEDARLGDRRELHTSIDARRDAPRLAELSQRIFGAWCNLL